MNHDVQAKAFDAFRRNIYKKNLHYVYPGPIDPDEFAYIKAYGGSPAMSAWLIQKLHQKVGVQMQVAKEVSDDLILSDFSHAATVDGIPWMNPVIEVFFEDPLLPTILLMKTTPDQIQEWVPQLEVDLKSEEYITALMQEGRGTDSNNLSLQLSLQLSPDMYEDFLMRGETTSMDLGPASLPLSDTDNCSMSFMMNLCLKVFAFASIPRYRPALINRKQMHKHGKPGVKGRPIRPTFRIVYAPKVVRDPCGFSKQQGDREFRGRRGHLHWYHHDRFVNRKGTWDFLPPIPNPKTGEYPKTIIIRVRKPK